MKFFLKPRAQPCEQCKTLQQGYRKGGILKIILKLFFSYLRIRFLLTVICTTIHKYPIFSTRYSVMSKIYTGYYGTSEIEHGLCACTVDNPLAKAWGLSLRKAHKPCSISHFLSNTYHWLKVSREVDIAFSENNYSLA